MSLNNVVHEHAKVADAEKRLKDMQPSLDKISFMQIRWKVVEGEYQKADAGYKSDGR